MPRWSLGGASTPAWCVATAMLLARPGVVNAQTPAEELARLRGRYAAVASASVVLRLEGVVVNGQPYEARRDVVVTNEGWFATTDYDTLEPQLGETWEARPRYFVFLNESELVVARAPGGTFLRRGSTPQVAADLRTQTAFCPWPRIAAWCDELISAADLHAVQTGDEWEAGSETAGLSITWAASGAIRAVEMALGAGGASHRVEFDGFATRQGDVPTPATLTETVSLPAGVRPPVRWRVESVGMNPPNTGELLTFDAAVWGVGRYDEATANVYAPDGSLLVNENEFFAAYDRARSRSARGGRMWYIGIGLAVLVSAGLAWYRLRSRSP